MGNKLCVDNYPSSIDNIISFPIESLPSPPPLSSEDQYQHISMWSFSETQVGPQAPGKDPLQITSVPIELTNIHKTHFLLNSNDVYIILLIFKKEKLI